LFGSFTFFCVYIYNVCIGIQLRLSSFCLFTIFELLSSIGKERRTFYSQVVRSPPIVPVIQQADGFKQSHLTIIVTLREAKTIRNYYC